MQILYKSFLTILLYCIIAAPVPYEVFISPTGNDSNPGTTFLPLKTFSAALDNATSNKTNDGSIITLLPGTYKIDSVITISAKHSGKINAPLIIRGKQGDTAILSGGVELKFKDSKPCDKNDIASGIDSLFAKKIRKWSFVDIGITDTGFWAMENIKNSNMPQLYCNDTLQQLAKWPDTGYAKIDSVIVSKPIITNGKVTGDSVGKFIINTDFLNKAKKEMQHAFMYGYWYWDWSENYELIDSINIPMHIIRVALPSKSIYGYKSGQRYYIGNLLCQINKEGKWAVDPIKKIIYFWAPENLDMKHAVITNNNKGIVVINGSSNIKFQNISIKNCIGNGIEVTACTSLTLSKSTITGMGANGIVLTNSALVRVDNCDISNIGKSPVSISGSDRKALIPSNIIIANNSIHDFGLIKKTFLPAVYLSLHSVGCKIINNTIYNGPHSAIIYLGNSHIIENNLIYNVCTETQDVGVIYSNRDWTARGTIVQNNYIENCGTGFVAGIYLDDQASGSTLKNNIIKNITQGIKIGGGRNNYCFGNIVVGSQYPIYADSRGLATVLPNLSTLTSRLNSLPYTDSIWVQTFPALSIILKDDPGCPKGNVVKGNTFINFVSQVIKPEHILYGIFDSNIAYSSNSYYLPSSKNYGVQKNLNVDTISPVTLHRMPVIPLVRNVFSKDGVLYVACVPSYYSGHLKAKITNLRSRKVYNGSGMDTIAFPQLIAGDYVFNVWYTDILYQDSTFSTQDTVFFSPEATLQNNTVYLQPDNPCVLDGCSVDTTRIAINWKVNKLKDVVFDSIGVWYNEFGYPGKAYDSGAVKVGCWNLKVTHDTIAGLKADKRYYFSIFGRDTAGSWSKPSDSAKIQIRTGKKFGSSSGYPIILQGSDADTLFEDSLVLSGNEFANLYIDTIDRWEIPVINGFLRCGPSFIFRNGNKPVNASMYFNIGTFSPISPFTLNDIRVYRFNVNAMAWRLDTAKLTYDILRNRLFFSTNELSLPFALMIDTMAPVVNLYAADTTPCKVADPIYDTVTIRDNIENPQITLLAGAGSTGYSNLSYFISSPGGGLYTTTIPAYVADPVSGLRSFLTVSDGRFSDMINLSRKIERTGNNYDNKTIQPMQWTPISVTAQPKQKSIGSVFAQSLGCTIYNYDSCQFRIMRLLPSDPKGIDLYRWVEYGSDTTVDFSFSPGSNIWVKSKNSVTISFNTAIIPALIDTFQVILKKGVWNDFSLPYNFDIFVGDIINATNRYDSLTDGIELHEWIKSGNTYSTQPVYLPGIDDETALNAVLKAGSPYITFNNADHDITLRIPPVCTAVSKHCKENVVVKKKAVSQQWSIKLGFRDESGAELSTAYCLSLPENKKPRYYQAAPTFAPVSARVLDRKGGKRFGHAASGDLSGGGASFIISCENRSEHTSHLTAAIEKITGLPAETKAFLYFDGKSFDTTSVNLCTTSISANQQQTGYLIVGSASYVSGFIKNLQSVFSFSPFTSNHVLRIRYTLPVDVKKVTTSIFDLKGGCLKRTVRTSGLNAGEGLVTIDRRFVSGYYVVQMKIETIGGNKPTVLNRRWMFVQ